MLVGLTKLGNVREVTVVCSFITKLSAMRKYKELECVSEIEMPCIPATSMIEKPFPDISRTTYKHKTISQSHEALAHYVRWQSKSLELPAESFANLAENYLSTQDFQM